MSPHAHDFGRPAGPEFIVPKTLPPEQHAPQPFVDARRTSAPGHAVPTRITTPASTPLPNFPGVQHLGGPVPAAPDPSGTREPGRRLTLLVVGCLLAGTIAGGGAGLMASAAYPQGDSGRTLSTGSGGSAIDATSAAAALLPSVVQIRTGTGRGSGFVMDDLGHVMTNHHVIAGFSGVDVQLADGRVARARVVGSDPATDIAVLELIGTTPPAADLGASPTLRIGQPVIAVGSPLGLSSTVTAGIVSSVDRPARVGGPGLPEQPMIQTDASINPGNSGGPLADLDGHVVGMNTAIATVGGAGSGNIGIGFSVPIDNALVVARRIIENG